MEESKYLIFYIIINKNSIKKFNKNRHACTEKIIIIERV